MVVLPAEVVESGLLSALGPLRRACGFGFERPVPALMTAVLLRPSRLNPLVPDAKLDPADTQLREAAEGRCGKGRSVISANGPRQTIHVEEALEDGLCLHLFRGEPGRTAQQIARVGVCHRERIAIHTVSGAELPFKIGRPDLVWRTGMECRNSRMLRPAPALLGPRQPCFAEELTGAAGGRQLE